MTTPTRLMTAEEFMQLPSPPDGGKIELAYGKVVRMAPVGGEHGQKAAALTIALGQFAHPRNLGVVSIEVGFRLQRDPDLVRAPDVCFLARERLPSGGMPTGFVEGPPTLAVEVVSPSDTDTEVAGKVEEYLQSGADRVWVVRPEQRTITVHRPDGNAHVHRKGGTLSSDDAGFAVEGFELAVSDVFP